jgi:hypothetical protein
MEVDDGDKAASIDGTAAVRRSSFSLGDMSFLLHRSFDERQSIRGSRRPRLNYPLQSCRWKSRASG